MTTHLYKSFLERFKRQPRFVGVTNKRNDYVTKDQKHYLGGFRTLSEAMNIADALNNAYVEGFEEGHALGEGTALFQDKIRIMALEARIKELEASIAAEDKNGT